METDKKAAFTGESSAIEGKNAVLEALRAGRAIDKVYMVKRQGDKALDKIAALSRSCGAVVVEADPRKLDAMSESGAHQGVIAVAAVREYCTLGDILDIARDAGEPPFIVACDGVCDPHNLGAIIRTAESAGVHGIIIPKRRSAGLTATVGKTSAGAAEHMAVARVSNLPSALLELKKAGVWIYGTDSGGGSNLWNTDFRGAVCVVIGSEGEGMGALVSDRCDFLVSIPMYGKISSLNASACAAVVLYEALRQRRADG